MAEATPIDVQWAAGNQQEVGQYGSKSRNWTMDASSVRLCGSLQQKTQQLLEEEIHGDHECRGRSSLILQMNREVWAFNCQKLGCIKRKGLRLQLDWKLLCFTPSFFVFLFVEEGISVYFGLSGGQDSLSKQIIFRKRYQRGRCLYLQAALTVFFKSSRLVAERPKVSIIESIMFITIKIQSPGKARNNIGAWGKLQVSSLPQHKKKN